MKRAAKYPQHLAKYVAARLRGSGEPCPPESVLQRLFETMYFASLRTDEGRPCRVHVNYIDNQQSSESVHASHGDRWACVRFDRPFPLDVPTLTKLAEAADPAVSSLAVFADAENKLFVWGMIDQELRYPEYAALDWPTSPHRPGLFQVGIHGVGSIAVYKDYSLICSLEQNTLVQQYHDVLWYGPIHTMLRSHVLDGWERRVELPEGGEPDADAPIADELLTRWLNSLCRILLHVQQYRHGGGLLIVPRTTGQDVNVKYRLRYDRLPRALASLVSKHQRAHGLMTKIHGQYRDPRGLSPCQLHEDLASQRKQVESHRNELLGCIRFIASLSRVDGFVMLDRDLVVHGFGVELRTDSPLGKVFLAGDSHANPRLMRTATLDEFGTRHRAMMRHCFEKSGTIGFVVSQDGEVRAMTRIGDRLIMWENINVQLAFRAENRMAPPHFLSLPTDVAPLTVFRAG
jgi:hypothetical protein